MAQIYDYDIVLESGKHITQDGGTVANSASLAPAYDSTATYAVGDLCTHLGSLYSCSTAIGTAEEWDATHWTEATVAEHLGGGSAPMVEITWAELKALRDAGTLIPGMQYRITDYQCTTTTANTSSANHQFDIIVTADDESHLNEVARAALHSGDTYFANCKMNAWQLWYCLDNDTNRFAWADTTNGKGVIYRMIDEFGNDVPYDFKSMLFTKSGKFTNSYTFNCYIYRGGSWVNGDASLIGDTKYCRNNIIRPYCPAPIYSSGKMIQYLNFTVFYTNSTDSVYVYNNTIDANNYNNYFTNRYIFKNTIGKHFQNNTISITNFSGNSIGDSCTDNNIIGGYFELNTIGTYFKQNTIAGTFDFNTVGNECNANTFNGTFQYNKIGNKFYANTLSIASNNTFENNIQNNNIGSYFNNNFVGASSQNNLFGAYVLSCYFGSSFLYNNIGTSTSSTIAVSKCYFDSGITYIRLTSNDEYNSTYIQHVNVHFGVAGSSGNLKVISVPRNLTYSTDIYAIGSVREEI